MGLRNEDVIGEPREAKLPAWALLRLEGLRRAVREQQEEIEQLKGTPGLSKTTFTSSYGVNGPTRTPLREDKIIFKSPLRFTGRPSGTLTEIQAKVLDSGHGVEVYCTDGGLIYVPRSSNAGLLVPVDRWELVS